MDIAVLGPLEVEVDGVGLDLGARKRRSVLAVLALHRGRAVSVSTIVEAVWGEVPPPSYVVTLQGYVSGLRKVLEHDRPAGGPFTVLVTSDAGYTLQVPATSIDAVRLEGAAAAAAAAFPTAPDEPWSPSAAVDRTALAGVAEELDAALAAWRGEPYADLGDHPDAVAERARLHEERTTAFELREAIRSYLGDPLQAARRLEPIALRRPHRERLWMLYAVALVRAGRQVDGLAALRTLRSSLRDDLGIIPGRPVSELETAILNQTLEPAADPAPATPTPTAVPPPAAAARERVRVVLVDDHPVFRMGMASLLRSLDGVEVAASVSDAATARAAVDDRVDVVLMDLDLGDDSGIDLTGELVGRFPGLKVLAMTMHEDDHHVMGALRAGAAGYLHKSAEAEDVERALRGVVRGELIVGSAVAAAARTHLAGLPEQKG